MLKYKHIYDDTVGNCIDDVDINILKDQVKKLSKNVKPEAWENVWQIMVQTTAIIKQQQEEIDLDKKPIEKENEVCFTAYMQLLKIWAAFSATDINQDHVLDKNGVFYLLWVFEQEKPSDFRVQDTIQNTHANESGEISRNDWLKFLCDKNEKGQMIFRNDLRVAFQEADTENSGTLNVRELEQLLEKVILDQIKNHDNYKKLVETDQFRHFELMVQGVAQETIIFLDGNNDKLITWVEFKQFMDKSMKQQKKLVKFLEDLLNGKL